MPKKLIATGFVVRDGKGVERKLLPKDEQARLAARWNGAAMEAAGFAPAKKVAK